MGRLGKLPRLAIGLATSGVMVLFGLAGGVLLLVPMLHAIGMLVGVGLMLVIVRYTFLLMIPTLCKMAKTLTFAINLLLIFVDVAVTEIKAVIFVFQEIIYAAKTILGAHAGPPSFSPLALPEHVDDHDVKAFLNEVAATCPAYDGLPPIWTAISKYVGSPTVCPIIRATYPLQSPWYEITNTTLGWLSHDSEPYPGNNCRDPTAGPAWVCVWLGTGYLVLELLIPVLIGGVFFYTTAGPLFGIVARLFRVASIGATTAIQLPFQLLERL